MTFLAKVGNGRWRNIGTDDNAPYRVFHDVADIEPGTTVRYRAVVLDNARHRRSSAVESTTIAPPAITLEAPTAGGRVRGTVEVRAIATPDHPDNVVRFERSVNGGPFTTVSTDDSSPVYTAFDDTAGLPDQATVTYRAVLTYAPGRTVTSDTRTVTVVQTPVTTAIVHYNRPGGDYGALPNGWGLHLWGDAVDPAVLATVAWDRPFQRTGIGRVRRGLRDPAHGRHEGRQLHHAPPERRLGARHPRAGRRPLVRAARPPGDLAQAGRPDGLLQPAAAASRRQRTRAATCSPERISTLRGG